VRFLGRGSAAGPLPISKVWAEEICHYPHALPKEKSSWICTNPVVMPVDGRGCPHPVPPVATLLPGG